MIGHIPSINLQKRGHSLMSIIFFVSIPPYKLEQRSAHSVLSIKLAPRRQQCEHSVLNASSTFECSRREQRKRKGAPQRSILPPSAAVVRSTWNPPRACNAARQRRGRRKDCSFLHHCTRQYMHALRAVHKYALARMHMHETLS